jgi:hypothetical protein
MANATEARARVGSDVRNIELDRFTLFDRFIDRTFLRFGTKSIGESRRSGAERFVEPL